MIWKVRARNNSIFLEMFMWTLGKYDSTSLVHVLKISSVHIYRMKAERIFVRKFSVFAEWVRLKLSSVHTWRMRADKSSHRHWCRINILWCLLNYRRPREQYRMRTKAFAIARSLLLYHPHIPMLDKQNAFVCSLSGICSVYVHAA